ncbi:MAG: UDP-glucose 4-epimerase GalE, partial [Pseudomonadota bacterium]
EVLDAVDRVTNLKIAREWADRRPGDPAALVADSRAIQARLGWAPRYADLDVIVTHALQWERALAERRG